MMSVTADNVKILRRTHHRKQAGTGTDKVWNYETLKRTAITGKASLAEQNKAEGRVRLLHGEQLIAHH
jgi:hypothetical protein